MNQEGRRLGRYNVLKRLGTGGMGDVYLALDTAMGRHVALKFLSSDLTADPEMLRRLSSEGLTASSLNHPNILTIYEIAEVEGLRFIAAEYVDGATLRVALERNLVDVATALDVATQVASALVAAHSAGIVHRDLKPGNIMIREDGYVKVIDFGLAKRVRGFPNRRKLDISVTRPGTVVGTVHYMSPEQAAGGAVDNRSDIWSLGIILFELVTRQLPFDGKTETEILTSIRDKPVPQLPAGLVLPPGLDQVIMRALEKDPARRFQSAREMLAALGAIHRPATHASPRPFRLARRSYRPVWIGLAGAALLLVLAALPLRFPDRFFGPDWFQIDKVRQLTFNGRVRLACLSPDGKYLAYVAGDPEGMQTLYLSQLNTATEQVKIPPRKVTYWGVTFSPDNRIYAVSEGADLMGKLYVVPLIGDAPEKPILVDIDGPVTFSPDGERFAFVRFIRSAKTGPGSNEDAVFLANRDGSNLQKLDSISNSTIIHQISWSPFTNQIAATYVEFSGPHSGRATLHLLSPDRKTQTVPLPNWRIVGQPWWADKRSLILNAAARSEWSVQYQLQQLDIRSGKVRNLTRDLAGYKSVSLTADHSMVAAVKTESRGSLWVSAAGDFSKGQTTLAEIAKYPSLSWPGDDHVLLDSFRNGFPNLWQVDIRDLTRTSLTNEASAEQDAVSVPGTRNVVLASNRSGQFKIWKFDPDTNTFAQLTSGTSYDQSPSVSPDGKWVVYTAWSASSPQLRRVSIDGGESKPLLPYAQDGQFSPDGNWMVCYAKGRGGWTVSVFPLADPAAIRPVPGGAQPFAWSLDGRSIHSVITDSRGVSNIWAVPLDGSPAHAVTSFEDQQILKFAWSPAGDRLACLRASFGSDVALFTRLR